MPQRVSCGTRWGCLTLTATLLMVLSASSAPTPHSDAVRFLKALFADAPAGSYIELRSLGPDKRPDGKLVSRQRWFPVENVEAAALAGEEDRARGADVYMGCAPRKRHGGGAADVACLLALIADLDVGPGKAHEDKPAAMKAINALASTLGLAPSLLVDSGGGLHAYYLLSEPMGPEEFAAAAILMDRLALALGNLEKPLDTISDPPRILRMPGTTNCKPGRPPSPVRLLVCEPDRRYHLFHFDDLPELPEGAAAPQQPFSGELPTDLSPKLKRVMEATKWPLREVRKAGRLQALVLKNKCPACASVNIPGRDPPRVGATHVAPICGALRCKRARCPATGEGLPLDEWVPLYAPHAVEALADPAEAPAAPPLPANVEIIEEEYSTLGEAREALRTYLRDEAIPRIQDDPNRIEVLSDGCGLGKTEVMLGVLRAHGGTLYGPTWALLDEHEKRLGMDVCRAEGLLRKCILPADSKENLKRAVALGYPSRLACIGCRLSSGCPAQDPESESDIVLATHALLLVDTEKPRPAPHLIDEDPSGTLIECFSLDAGELANFIAQDCGQRPHIVEKWLSPRRPLLTIVGDTLAVLVAKRRAVPAAEAVYACRLGRAEWRAAFLEAAAPRGQQSLYRSQVDAHERLGDAVRSYRVAHAENRNPPSPGGQRLRRGALAGWPSPFLDTLLEALVQAGTDEEPIDFAACAVLVGRGDGAAAWLELRRLRLDALPPKAILADATAVRTWPILGAALGRPVRISRRRVVEAPGAVQRLFVRAATLSRRELLTGGDLHDRGAAAVARAIKFILRQANLGEGPRLAVLSHLPVTRALDAAWSSERGAHEGLASTLAMLRQSRSIGDLVTGYYHGGARGTDTMRDCDALLMLGDPVADLSATMEDGRLLARAAAARGHDIRPEDWMAALVAAELDQAEGRLRSLLATPDEPAVVVFAGHHRPSGPGWEAAKIVGLPKGRLQSEAAADASDLAIDLLESFGAVSPGLISLFSNKPQWFRGVFETARSAINKKPIWHLWPFHSDEVLVAISAIPDRTLRRLVTRVAGWLPVTKTVNPTRFGRAPGYWSWYESQRGAAAELAKVLREHLRESS